MPELPDQTRSRLCQRGLSPLDADFLMAIDSGREVGYDGYLGKGAVGYFDSVSEGRDPKVTVNWLGSPTKSSIRCIHFDPLG